MPNHEDIKKIVVGSLIIIIGLFFTKLLNYIFRLIIAKLGPDQYGLFSIGLGVVSFGAIIALMGMDRGMLRFISYYIGIKNNEKIKGTIFFILKFSLISSIIFGLIIFLASPYIASTIFHNKELSIIIKILAFSIPAYVLSEVTLSIIRAFREVKYVVYSKNIFESLSKIILSVIAIYFGYKLFGISIAYVISLVLGFIMAFYFVEKKLFSILNKSIITKYSNKEIFSYSWPLMINNIMELSLIWVDTLLIGYFKTSSDVGIYNAAFPTAMLLTAVPVAILTLFTPTMGKLMGENKINEQKDIFNIISKWIFLVALPLTLFIMFFPKEILKILFGNEYITGYIALSILAFGFLISAISFTSRKILEVYKKSKLILINSIIAVLLNIILNIILIKRYGINGAAISSAISFLVYSLIFIIQSSIKLKFKQPIKDYIKILLAGIIASVLILVISKYIIKNFFVLLFLFILTYFISIIILKVVNKRELMLIKLISKKN